MTDTLLEAARILCDHRISHRKLLRLDASVRPANEARAYAVQDELHGLLTAAGLGRVAGHKVGCTTKVMQEFLRIPNPCAGGVFEAQVHHTPAQVPYGEYLRPGVECEVAVQLATDLRPRPAPFDRTAVAAAVGAVMAGMEIVDDRYVNYKDLDTPTLIADDFFDAGCVLGRPVSAWRTLDLGSLVGVTYVNGVEVGRGQGADVMGHPLEALVWLANSLARRGRYLRAGEFVFTGSVVETRWVERGDRVTMTIDKLGTVEAVFR